MYKVLLVDDEPLVLAGIKFMIDWSTLNCELAATAQNGKQAIDQLDKMNPDIVIADIKMPVMNGIELLRYAQKHYPCVVFIMLTSYPEFELVQESMRLGAIDYLIKTHIDEASLKKSIVRACQKSQERKYLNGVDTVLMDKKEQHRERLSYAVGKLFRSGALTDAQRDVLADYGVWECYCATEIDIWVKCEDDAEKKLRLVQWLSEIVENLAKTCYKWYILTQADDGRLNLLHSNAEDLIFTKKLTAVSQNIIGIEPFIIHCGPFSGDENAKEMFSQLKALRTHQYLNGEQILTFKNLPDTEYLPLGFHGISSRLAGEINSRRAKGCASIIDQVSEKMKKTPHERDEMLWLFSELYDTAQEALQDLSGSHEEIEQITTLDSALNWLQKLKNEIVIQLEPKSSDYADFLEKARQYVYDNIDKRILLQDAARAACISPAYLSSLFKREYNQSFIDFVNQTKIERACELITENRFRIGEIGYMLGFENADYFSKVFRRHMSMSPSEFQHRHNAENNIIR